MIYSVLPEEYKLFALISLGMAIIKQDFPVSALILGLQAAMPPLTLKSHNLLQALRFIRRRIINYFRSRPSIPALPSESKVSVNQLAPTVRTDKPRGKRASSGKSVRRKSDVTSPSSAEEKKPVLSLVEACRVGDVAQVKRHIEEQADLSQVEKDFTALQAACFYGQAVIVDVLSEEKGLVVNRENAQRETALFLAAKKGHWPIVDFLLNHASQWQLEIHPTTPPY